MAHGPAAPAQRQHQSQSPTQSFPQQILGYQGDVLRLRVTAPPAGGRANEAVISLLAEALSIAKSRVRIVRGHASREKLVTVESLDQEETQRRLAGQPGPPGGTAS